MNLSELSLPAHFSGIVRLFPLPDLVLYPGVVQALHVFEPRYRKMARDTLDSDQLISMCLYDQSSEQAMETPLPPIYTTICIAKVVAHKELEDGRINLLVMGLQRARIIRELPVELPYRMAEVKVLESATPNEDCQSLRAELIEACDAQKLLKKIVEHDDLKRMLESNAALGLLVDLVSFSAGLDCGDRQSILELADVAERCRRLIGMLRERENDDDRPSSFPPEFSSN